MTKLTQIAKYRFIYILELSLLQVVLVMIQDPPLAIQVLQVAVVVPFVLLFPGYCLMMAAFPTRAERERSANLGLSFGLSLVLLAFLVLILSALPWGISLGSVTLGALAIILLLMAVTLLRQGPLTSKARFEPLQQLETLQASRALDRSPRMVYIITALLAFITLGEYLSTTLVTVQVGLVMHGLALVALLLLAALREDIGEQRIYLTLAFAPLIRLVSLSMPLQGLPMMYWYLLVGIPISLSVVMVMRYGKFTRQELGLTGNKWFLQILFGLTGIGLGYIEYLILRPEPLADELTLRAIWLPAFILVVFTGFLEEIIFRGLMQSAFGAKIGRWLAILLISGLFAVLHLGYHSLLDVIFVFLVALLFALVTEWTGSIWGVSIAHGLTNVALFLVFPFIIGQGMQLQLPARFSDHPTPTVQILAELPRIVPSDRTLTTPSISPSATFTLSPTPTEMPSVTPSVAQIIVDDDDPGFIHEGGEYWDVEQGYQGHLVWDFTRLNEPDAFITWEPSISVCGSYLFEVYIPLDFGLAQAVFYDVTHRDGLDEVEINQDDNQGEWVSLGEYWCNPGRTCRVDANNLTRVNSQITLVAFDALRLTFIEGCE